MAAWVAIAPAVRSVTGASAGRVAGLRSGALFHGVRRQAPLSTAAATTGREAHTRHAAPRRLSSAPGEERQAPRGDTNSGGRGGGGRGRGGSMFDPSRRGFRRVLSGPGSRCAVRLHPRASAAPPCSHPLNAAPCDATTAPAPRRTRHMPPDLSRVARQQWTMHTALLIAAKEHHSDEALNIIRDMADLGLMPSSLTYRLAIHLLVFKDRLGEVTELLHAMTRAQLVADVGVINLVLAAFATTRNAAAISEIEGIMRTMGVEPDLWTYAALVSGYFLTGQHTRALDIFDAFREGGLDHRELYFMLYRLLHPTGGRKRDGGNKLPPASSDASIMWAILEHYKKVDPTQEEVLLFVQAAAQLGRYDVFSAALADERLASMITLVHMEGIIYGLLSEAGFMDGWAIGPATASRAHSYNFYAKQAVRFALDALAVLESRGHTVRETTYAFLARRAANGKDIGLAAETIVRMHERGFKMLRLDALQYVVEGQLAGRLTSVDVISIAPDLLNDEGLEQFTEWLSVLEGERATPTPNSSTVDSVDGADGDGNASERVAGDAAVEDAESTSAEAPAEELDGVQSTATH